MSGLEVDFCGFSLINPFLLAAGPATASGAMIRRAFQAGWAGAVTKTLVVDASLAANVSPRLASLAYPGDLGPKKIFGFLNIELLSERSLEAWLKDIEMLAAKHPDRMTVASIMADVSDPEAWQDLARKVQAAGADAIEINLSCPHGVTERGLGQVAGRDPDLAARVTAWVRAATTRPVMVKLTPNLADITLPARACLQAGADALTAINTVSAIPGVDLDALVPLPNVWGSSTPGGLSGPAIKPIALKAVADLALAFDAPISGVGGVTSWRDAAEFILLGANHVQVCSAVMARGVGIIEDLCRGLEEYLEDKDFDSPADLRGQALKNLKPHAELEARPKATARIDQDLCTACDACRVSCRDAGYQAIAKNKDGDYVVNKAKCAGCSLCLHVCPVEGCISLNR